MGIFRANFTEKQRRKQEERFQKKIYIGRMLSSGQEKKTQSLSNTVLKYLFVLVLVLKYFCLYLFQATRKT